MCLQLNLRETSRSDRFLGWSFRRESRRSSTLIECPATCILPLAFSLSLSFFSSLFLSPSRYPSLSPSLSRFLCFLSRAVRCGRSAVHLRSSTGTVIFVLLPHPPRSCPTTVVADFPRTFLDSYGLAEPRKTRRIRRFSRYSHTTFDVRVCRSNCYGDSHQEIG